MSHLSWCCCIALLCLMSLNYLIMYMSWVRIPPEAAHFFSREKKGVVFGRSCLLCLVSLNEFTCTLTSTADVCHLPPEVGPCDAVVPSYFFNATTGRCDMFDYGGCGGNGNRFSTREECRRECAEEGGWWFHSLSVSLLQFCFH